MVLSCGNGTFPFTFSLAITGLGKAPLAGHGNAVQCVASYTAIPSYGDCRGQRVRHSRRPCIVSQLSDGAVPRLAAPALGVCSRQGLDNFNRDYRGFLMADVFMERLMAVAGAGVLLVLARPVAASGGRAKHVAPPQAAIVGRSAAAAQFWTRLFYAAPQRFRTFAASMKLRRRVGLRAIHSTRSAINLKWDLAGRRISARGETLAVQTSSTLSQIWVVGRKTQWYATPQLAHPVTGTPWLVEKGPRPTGPWRKIASSGFGLHELRYVFTPLLVIINRVGHHPAPPDPISNLWQIASNV